MSPLKHKIDPHKLENFLERYLEPGEDVPASEVFRRVSQEFDAPKNVAENSVWDIIERDNDFDLTSTFQFVRR